MELETRVALSEQRLDVLERESQRTRQRLHDLSADRATVRLLAERVRELSNQIEKIAQRAAERAVAVALEHREELSRGRWSLRSQWMATGIAFGGFIASLAYLLSN